MKVTQVLSQQHVLRWFQRHWHLQGKRRVAKTRAFEVLKQHNIPFEDAVKFASVPKERIDFTPNEDFRPVKLNESHPEYKEEPLCTFKDHNVLVEGVNQAKLLTKTIEIKEGLPTPVENLIGKISHPDQHTFIERLILSSVAFDLKQEKLPRIIDPEKPMFKGPPRYGVGDRRRNQLLCSRLLQLCENIFGAASNDRRIINDAVFSVPFIKDGKKLQFEVTSEILLTANSKLPPLADIPRNEPLPDLYPLQPTISMEETNFYETKNIFPLKDMEEKQFIHTAFLHFNPDTEVKNMYETPVTDSQFQSRSLVKGFAIAAAQARKLYGDDVIDLPEPVVLQTIQTDSVNFHFSVFQLNTLNISEDHDTRNVWWSDSISRCYSEGDFISGIPVLRDYNPEVFEKILAFYANGCS